MRIGILTLPLHTNYGGILQAYALQTVLERMGHEVEIINKVPYKDVPWYRLIFLYISRAFRKKILGHKEIHIFRERDYFRLISSQRIHVKKFIKSYMNVRNVCDMAEVGEYDYDTIVVGSDQIWRLRYIESMMEDAFLSFAKSWEINRVAYAASFGVDTWDFSEEDSQWIKPLVKRFNAISVREKSGIQLCKEFLKAEAIQVLDPTLLLTADDYNRLTKDCEGYDGNLMCYILDKCAYKDSVIKTISEETKLIPFDTTPNDEHEAQPPVEKWLRAFSQAEMVVTDSFHACVFSIIFHKPFIVISNKTRGNARFISLLSMFGLEDRLIKEESNFSMESVLCPIDYMKVDKLLNDWRALSLDFINKNIPQT